MFVLYRYYNFPVKGEAREIAQYIKSKKTMHDTVLVYDLMGGIDALIYYYPEIYSINYLRLSSLKEIVKKNDNFWLLISSRYKEAPYKILEENGGGENFSNIYYLSEEIDLKTTKAIFFKRGRLYSNKIIATLKFINASSCKKSF